VLNRGGQSVLASSVAPKDATLSGGGGQSAVSEHSGLGDLWSGFGAPASPAASGASSSSAGAGGGLGLGVGIGMAILALGLAGALGTFLVPALRRRRAEATSETGAKARTGGSGSSET